MNIIYTLKTKRSPKQAAVITELSTTAVSKESITSASTAVSVKVTETEADAETELPKNLWSGN